MKQVKHMAEFLTPGSFMPEEYSLELSDRSIDAALAVAPKHAYSFTFYDSPVVDFEFDAERFRVLPIAQNKSARHYLGGVVFTCDELRALAGAEGKPGRYDVLIANVTQYVDGLPVEGRAIRCRTGNWQPFEDVDTLVEVRDAA